MEADRSLDGRFEFPLAGGKLLAPADRHACLEEHGALVDPEGRANTDETRRHLSDDIAVGPRRRAKEADLDSPRKELAHSGVEAELEQFLIAAVEVQQSLGDREATVEPPAVHRLVGKAERSAERWAARREHATHGQLDRRRRIIGFRNGRRCRELVIDGCEHDGRSGLATNVNRSLCRWGIHHDHIAVAHLDRIAGLDVELIGRSRTTDGHCRQHHEHEAHGFHAVRSIHLVSLTLVVH